MGHTRKIPFSLIGQFEGYALSQSGKVRRLHLETSQGLCSVKLTHASCIDLLRGVLSESIQRGSWLEVTGVQKIDPQGGVKSLKAERVMVATFPKELDPPCVGLLDLPIVQQSAKAKVLVCQQSSCRKRGSKQIQWAVEREIGDRALDQQVCVKAVGCLKHCSKGPNLVINKTHYRNVSHKDVIALLDQHFAPRRESIPAL
jgi:(2Fe-2S) ferredoxin